MHINLGNLGQDVDPLLVNGVRHKTFVIVRRHAVVQCRTTAEGPELMGLCVAVLLKDTGSRSS